MSLDNSRHARPSGGAPQALSIKKCLITLDALPRTSTNSCIAAARFAARMNTCSVDCGYAVVAAESLRGTHTLRGTHKIDSHRQDVNKATIKLSKDRA